jgi:iron complex transport system ATP-binding protein
MTAPALIALGLALPGRLIETDLTLKARTLTFLVGPNGAGKTSLLHRMAGIGEGTGSTQIAGDALQRLSPTARIGKIAFLSANREIAWPLVARDLVALGFGARAHDHDAVAETLASLDATQFAHRRMDQLSTGERARILLARALVARPDVLLLDEPAAHLDPARQIAMLERLRAEADRGATVLASIHDLALARNFGDRIIVMREGEIVADGTPSEALAPAIVQSVFGVRWEGGTGWVRANS